MSGTPTGLVDVVREFLEAHRLMTRLSARFRRGELRFAEIEKLIGDDEGAVLYRLKERCHSLFRPEAESSGVAMRREVLFDLAVGSLFHEAMKFRENLYQREVYGPRVRALRSQSGEEANALFEEFEKILSLVSQRLEEELEEVEALFLRTREQLRVLLVEYRQDGHLVRCLVEHEALVRSVFGEGLDAVLEEIYGEAVEGYVLAGRSYLSGRYFPEAEHAFERAAALGGERAELARLRSYARGMAAYFAGDYAESVAQLGRWIEMGTREDAPLAEFAHAAVSRIEHLVPDADREGVIDAATALLARLGSLRSRFGIEARSSS